MAILTDFNGVAISAIVASAFREKIPMERNMIKHIVITSFLNINKKLAGDFGKHYLLVDSRSWRKEAFPYYKANRKKAKDDSALDWELIFSVLNEMKEDFDLYFPFQVFQHDNCEADDLIASLTKYLCPFEDVVIVSKDKDFHQLINYNVRQYNPMNKDFFDISDARIYRLEHILNGDSGDGVPNVLSDDAAFVNKNKSQKKMTVKRKEILLRLAEGDFKNITEEDAHELKISEQELVRNWQRNKHLIDLTEIHQCGKEFIKVFETEPIKEKTVNDLTNYLVKNKMVVLMGKVNDFFIKEKTKEEKLIKPRTKTASNTKSLKQFM